MKPVFLIGVFLLMGLLVNGQSLNELRQKKEKTQEQIKYTNRLLNETRQNEKSSLNKLKIIGEQIKLRNQLITGYNSEIVLLDTLINENSFVVESLDRDMKEIKKEYAEMVRFAQKNKSAYNKILFLLSSKNVNQAYKRMVYLQQYAEYRKKQAELIISIRHLLDLKVQRLEQQKQQKQQLVNNKKQETNQLAKEKSEQGKQVTLLQKQQKELKKKLEDQQQAAARLNKEIERIIEEEARKSKAKGVSGFVMTPEQKLVSGQFEKNSGRLPWPVEKGIITEQFGVHDHEVLKLVKVRNNGIDISTTPGAKARTVFNGEISRVFGIAGSNLAVIIRHGNYLTVYSNLKDVSVKAGDKVQAKQNIGTIFTDVADDNKTVLKFQIWKESEKLDPEKWLSK